MVYEILFTGEEHAQTGRELSARLGIPIRNLTAAIERERRQGKPICANTRGNYGYYIPPDREAMQAYCKALKRREAELAKTRKACALSIEKLPFREKTPHVDPD